MVSLSVYWVHPTERDVRLVSCPRGRGVGGGGAGGGAGGGGGVGGGAGGCCSVWTESN